VATKAQIQVSVAGFKQLQNLQASVKALAPQIDKANAAFIRLSGASKQTLPIVANLRAELEKSKRAFQASVLGTKAAVDAAKTQVNAERLLNNELERRNKLLNQVRATPVEKSIARNEAKPKRFQTGFTAFSQDVSKQAQERLIQQKKEELAVTEAIARAENRRLNALAEQVVQRKRQQVSGRIEIQRVTNPKFAGGGSSGSTIRSMDRTGFAAFSKRATEIQKTTKAEIALAKSRSDILKKTRLLASIERRRAKTESFGANFRRFRRGRTSADRAVRGRVGSSALIGGGFPLLFGGGPISALAGGLGGGIGELFGKGGGFAGSIAATAIAQTIQQAVTAISELGQALGPFTQDTEAVTTALGLQGSAQQAQLQRIEETQGKTAAFNAAMKIMAARITQDGVDKLTNFGENTRLLGQQFTIALTKLQAFAAGVANFVIRLTGLRDALQEREATRIVSDAAATGDTVAQSLVERRESAEALRGQGGEGNRKKNLLDQIKLEERVFAIQQKVSVEVDQLVSKSASLILEKQKELEMNKRIEEIMKTGVNKELAKSIAEVEQIFDAEEKLLLVKQEQAKAAYEKAIVDTNDKNLQSELLEKYLAITSQLEIQNGLREDAIDLTKDLNNDTDKIKEAFESLSESINNDIKEGIKGLIKGTSTLGDMLNNIADKFLDLALNQALFGSILGSKGEKGGGLLGAIGLFANGGRPPVGKPSIVGEKGPELFVPRTSGTIVPNNKLGGGGNNNVTVNVDASGSDVQGDDAGGQELGTLIAVAVQGELVKQQRPGGLLNR